MRLPFILLLSIALNIAFSVEAQSESTSSTATSIVLHGSVVDAKTGEPLSFATLSVGITGIATASNVDGKWRIQLPAQLKAESIKVTYLGYQPKTILIADITENFRIVLEPRNYEMAEVVVSNTDFCKEFLKKAWDAIPENYATEPTLCEGFYRETQRLKDSTYLYFNEAVLQVYKNSYKNTTNFGQIKVEKSRKNVFPGIDSINDVRFYGGPHFPNDLDIVFSRWDFIKPSEYSKWKIEMAGSFRDNNSEIYVLTFKNRKLPNSNFQGKMYIDGSTYAFIGFEFWRAGLSALAATQYPHMEYIPGMTSIKVGYSQMNGLYYLGFINYQTNGYNTVSQKRVFKDIEYVTTSQQIESVKPIPFNEQFDYKSILSIEAQPYDSSYWKDYNILEESKMMQNQNHLNYKKEDALKQLTTVYNKELTQAEKTLLFMKRFTLDGGFAYLPFSNTSGNGSLTCENQAIGSFSIKSGSFGLSTMDGIRFDLNRHWAVFGRTSAMLYGFDQFQLDLGLNYRISIAPSGRWFFLDLGLAASSTHSRFELGEVANPASSLILLGKTFDSKNLILRAGEKGYGLKPSLSLAVRMGKQYELFTEATWLLMPKGFSRDYIQVREKEGPIFGHKSVKYDWNDANLQLNVNGASVQKPVFDPQPLNVRIGIRSGF